MTRILTYVRRIVMVAVSLLLSAQLVPNVALACEGAEEAAREMLIEGNFNFVLNEEKIITIKNDKLLFGEKVESGNWSGANAVFKVESGKECYEKRNYAAKETCGVKVKCIKATAQEKFEIQPQFEAKKEATLKC